MPAFVAEQKMNNNVNKSNTVNEIGMVSDRIGDQRAELGIIGSQGEINAREELVDLHETHRQVLHLLIRRYDHESIQ